MLYTCRNCIVFNMYMYQQFSSHVPSTSLKFISILQNTCHHNNVHSTHYVLMQRTTSACATYRLYFNKHSGHIHQYVKVTGHIVS